VLESWWPRATDRLTRGPHRVGRLHSISSRRPSTSHQDPDAHRASAPTQPSELRGQIELEEVCGRGWNSRPRRPAAIGTVKMRSTFWPARRGAHVGRNGTTAISSAVSSAPPYWWAITRKDLAAAWLAAPRERAAASRSAVRRRRTGYAHQSTRPSPRQNSRRRRVRRDRVPRHQLQWPPP